MQTETIRLESRLGARYPFVEKLGTIPRIDVAKFLGICPSKLTRDASFFEIPTRTPLTLSQMFGVYVLYAYQRHIDGNMPRSSVAGLLKRKDCQRRICKQLNDLGKGEDYFLFNLERWLDKSGKPLDMAAERPEAIAHWERRRRAELAKARQVEEAKDELKKELAEELKDDSGKSNLVAAKLAKKSVKKRTPFRKRRRLPQSVAGKALGLSRSTTSRYIQTLKKHAPDYFADSRPSLDLGTFRLLYAMIETIKWMKKNHDSMKRVSPEKICRMIAHPESKIMENIITEFRKTADAEKLYNKLLQG